MTKAQRTPYLVKVPRRDAWHIRDGKYRRSTGETSKAAATRVLLGYIENKGGKISTSEPETIAEVIDYWVEVKKPGMLENGQWNKKWRFVVNTIKRHASDAPLVDAGFAWSRKYISGRRAEGVGGPTIRQELSTIRAAWKLCCDHELLSMSPKKFDLPAQSKPRERWLTRHEAAQLIDACQKPHTKLFVELALATAGRHGALLELQWSQVHFEKGQIDLRVSPDDHEQKERGQRKRRARVPISDRVVDILREARERTAGDHVIEYHGGSIRSCRDGVKAAAERAGIPGVITPHILRHTAATWMCQSGIDLWQVAGFLGHSSTKMVEQTYGHHCPDHMSAARDALEGPRDAE